MIPHRGGEKGRMNDITQGRGEGKKVVKSMVYVLYRDTTMRTVQQLHTHTYIHYKHAEHPHSLPIFTFLFSQNDCSLPPRFTPY